MELNHRHLRYKRSALTTELQAQNLKKSCKYSFGITTEPRLPAPEVADNGGQVQAQIIHQLPANITTFLVFFQGMINKIIFFI